MAVPAIEKWWVVVFGECQSVAGSGTALERVAQEAGQPWLEKASLAAGRKGGGLNAALLKHVPMKLESLSLRRALRKRGAQWDF